MNVGRKKSTGGGIGMYKDVDIKRQGLWLENGLKGSLECQREDEVASVL